MTKLELLNVALAVIGGLVAFGALHRMSAKTEFTIIAAFTLTAAGLGAQVYGSWPDNFQHSFDTLLFGGITALLIGTRRQTVLISPVWMPELSLAVSVITLLAFLFGIEQ